MLTCFRIHFLAYFLLVATLASVAVSHSHVAEVILDDELPPAVHGSNDVPTPPYPTVADEKFCHVEYQVMKRVIGKCIKLGRSLNGCAAGSYIQPLHPECN